jgi:colanic acid biosynthesis glycosyl transferase WcaI
LGTSLSRIVFINRYFYPDHSATSQMLSDLGFFLAASGREVCVVTSRQRYDVPDALLAPRETVRGVAVYRVRTTRFGRANLVGRALDYFTFYLAAGWAAWRLVRRGDMLVAKTDPPLISLVAMLVARLRGAYLVNWLQDVFPEVAGALGMRLGRGYVGSIIAAVRDSSLRAARCNVVLGVRMAESVAKRDIATERIAVIPNWADDRAIVPVAASANPLLAQWGLADKFVLGYSGNLGRAHEFGTILDAAALLQDDTRVIFLIIGSGARLPWLKDEAARRGLRNFVFQPYQPREQLAFSLGAADLHLVTLQPALEGLIVPSKFYGIAAAGRPVAFIGDQDGEIARILREQDCGRSFAVGDGAGLASYARGLAQDRSEVARLGRNARAMLESKYSQEKSFAAWEQILLTDSSIGIIGHV